MTERIASRIARLEAHTPVARIDPARQRIIEAMSTADIARLLKLRYSDDEAAADGISGILRRYNWPAAGV
ncbi:hypothetical protein [Thioflavicoccus mobilis]|uniref:hypothetical protein n=1 Tax=Thioflavicoccus mobilis TaxID=80679 RepID=UPI0005A0757B|nr:hypothetical protein [Thioflavicoccus mobilis]